LHTDTTVEVFVMRNGPTIYTMLFGAWATVLVWDWVVHCITHGPTYYNAKLKPDASMSVSVAPATNGWPEKL